MNKWVNRIIAVYISFNAKRLFAYLIIFLIHININTEVKAADELFCEYVVSSDENAQVSNDNDFEIGQVYVDIEYGFVRLLEVEGDPNDPMFKITVKLMDPLYSRRESRSRFNTVPLSLYPNLNGGRMIVAVRDRSQFGINVIEQRIQQRYDKNRVKDYFKLYRIAELVLGRNLDDLKYLRNSLIKLLNEYEFKSSWAHSYQDPVRNKISHLTQLVFFNFVYDSDDQGENEYYDQKVLFDDFVLKAENILKENLILSGILASLQERSQWLADRWAWPKSTSSPEVSSTENRYFRLANMMFPVEVQRHNKEGYNVAQTVEMDIDHYLRSYFWLQNYDVSVAKTKEVESLAEINQRSIRGKRVLVYGDNDFVDSVTKEFSNREQRINEQSEASTMIADSQREADHQAGQSQPEFGYGESDFVQYFKSEFPDDGFESEESSEVLEDAPSIDVGVVHFNSTAEEYILNNPSFYAQLYRQVTSEDNLNISRRSKIVILIQQQADPYNVILNDLIRRLNNLDGGRNIQVFKYQ